MILSIETSGKVCSLAVHEKRELLGSQTYNLKKSHSSLLPVIIGELLSHLGVLKEELIAIAISEGPGSYTGLRIGTSLAKGLCFGLEIPLIALNTLKILAYPVAKFPLKINSLIIPALDARRMEIYTAVFKMDMEMVWHTRSLILDENSFHEFINVPLIFIGDGALKCDIINHPNYSIHSETYPDAVNMGELAWLKFTQQKFVDLAYFEPNYLKMFQTKSPKNLLTNN